MSTPTQLDSNLVGVSVSEAVAHLQCSSGTAPVQCQVLVAHYELGAEQVRVFCAKCRPPCVAALCVVGGEILCADMEPESHILAQLRERSNSQIAPLEMQASALGVAVSRAP